MHLTDIHTVLRIIEEGTIYLCASLSGQPRQLANLYTPKTGPEYS